MTKGQIEANIMTLEAAIERALDNDDYDEYMYLTDELEMALLEDLHLEDII